MQFAEREYLINRIISGCTPSSFEDSSVLVYEPTPTSKVKAHYIYLEEYKKAELLGLLSEEEISYQLKIRGLWSDILKSELELLPKQIEELKVELYNSYFTFRRRDQIKKSLDSLKFREVELLQQRDRLKHVTCEGFAISCKNKYLICSATKDVDGELFFKDYENKSHSSLDIFIQEYLSNKMDEEVIRNLSRLEPWRSIWSAGKYENSIFGVPSSILSQEQKSIIIWSRIYDSAYESPECPPEEIIDDNDCFDGWMIVQSRNREREKQDQHSYKPGDKFNKADEVFISVDNPEDVERVNAMNSPTAIFRKQQRMNALTKSGGKLEEQYMPDSQNRMREQLVQMSLQKRG